MSILERRFRGRDEAKCCRYTVDDIEEVSMMILL